MLRRIEIVLGIVGISLLGEALGETYARWSYQEKQQRAFEVRRPVAPVPQIPAPVVAAETSKAPVKPDVKSAAKPAAKPPAPARARPRRTEAEPALARLEIPRLGVSAIVDEGDDDRTLGRAVGRVPESARPGEPGNVVLAGHRDTFFRPLRRIRVNDRIRLVVPPHTYEYRVESIRVVEPEETSVLASNGAEELTLVTCYPFYFVGHAPQRFIVKASRVVEEKPLIAAR
jgi:sortase A